MGRSACSRLLGPRAVTWGSSLLWGARAQRAGQQQPHLPGEEPLPSEWQRSCCFLFICRVSTRRP